MSRYVPRTDGGPDLRGNANDRRRRKQWLLDTYGNGATVPCYRAATHCGEYTLTFATLTVDRKWPGVLGGRYTRDNIRPACATCNSSTGGVLAHDKTAVPA